MVNGGSEAQSADPLQSLVEQRGLSRAYARDPEGVRAAAARGVRPLAPVPLGPLTEPAFIFDPAADADKE
jgi:hypothetical protein